MPRDKHCAAGIACLFFTLATTPAESPATAVDDQRLLNAASDPQNWLSFGQNYTNQRYSALAQITTDNVTQLAPRWTYNSGARGPFQVQPLIADGVMYLTLPGNDVVALDAATGTIRWRYAHQPRVAKVKGNPANRGAALAYGKVFTATNDGRLLALDRTSGKLVWDALIARPLPNELENLDAASRAALLKNIDALPAKMPPLVFRGKIIVGVTSAGYGIYYNLGVKTRRGPAPHPQYFLGKRGFIAAFDAETGNELWRWHTTRPHHWEGEFKGTTAQGESLGRDIPAERTMAATLQDRWRMGGSSTWSTPALDPSLGLIYLGTGNGSPNDVPSARPGDNLHASSLVALDVDSGELRWHYQYVPHDVWGYDMANPAVLFAVKLDNETVPAVGIAGKTGWFYAHDRRNGKLLFRSEAVVPQHNLFRTPTDRGVLISPGSFGGVSWSPSSYDPFNGILFIAGIHRPTLLRLEYAEEKNGRIPYIATDIAIDEPSWGTLSALDLNANGRIQWQVKTPQPLLGGVLATAGDLVFTGEGSGNFAAFDARSGARLWGHDLGAGVNAPPVSYQVGDEQFIAVAAGGSRFFGYAAGDVVAAFALPREAQGAAP